MKPTRLTPDACETRLRIVVLFPSTWSSPPRKLLFFCLPVTCRSLTFRRGGTFLPDALPIGWLLQCPHYQSRYPLPTWQQLVAAPNRGLFIQCFANTYMILFHVIGVIRLTRGLSVHNFTIL